MQCVKDSNHTSAPGKGNRPKPLDEHTIFHQSFNTFRYLLPKTDMTKAIITCPRVIQNGGLNQKFNIPNIIQIE